MTASRTLRSPDEDPGRTVLACGANVHYGHMNTLIQLEPSLWLD